MSDLAAYNDGYLDAQLGIEAQSISDVYLSGYTAGLAVSL